MRPSTDRVLSSHVSYVCVHDIPCKCQLKLLSVEHYLVFLALTLRLLSLCGAFFGWYLVTDL